MTPLIRFLWSRLVLAPWFWVGAKIEARINGPATDRWFHLMVSYAWHRSTVWHWPYGKKRISNFHDHIK